MQAQGYSQPMAPSYGGDKSPEDLMMAQQTALQSGTVPIEAIPQQSQQLAKRQSSEILDRYYQAWESAKFDENEEAYKASRYYHNKQWTDAEIKELRRRRQPITTKNRIKRKVDFLVGIEQRLRRDPKCYPRTPAAEKAAEISTACLRSVEDETKWQAIASAATKDALIRGVGVIWSGAQLVRGKAEVKKHHVPSDRFFYDPCSEAWDFRDTRYLGEWQWVDMDEAIEILPFSAETIETFGASAHDGALSTLPQEFAKSQNWQNWVDIKRRMLRITYIWYKYCGNWMFDYLVGPISLCPQDYDCLSPYHDEDGITEHPYLAWSPYIDESGNRYGVVRDMIPIQDEINKRTSKMLYMLSVRQTMGMAGAVADIEKMKLELAKPDGHVELTGTPDQNGFSIIDQSQQTQGQFELLQEAKAEIENLGPNPGLIGRGVEGQSGRAILAQQNSGMTELSPVFENLREWKLSTYHRDWRLLRQFWTGERYIRVTSDPKAVEFLHINRIVEDPITGQVRIENALAEMDVDVILDEGPDTVTMREELMEQLAQLGPGVVPPELLIEMSNISEKDMLLKRLQEAKAPPPELLDLQDKMAKLEMALNASKIDESVSKVENTRAQTMKVLGEAGMVGVPPALMPRIFPVSYREPTFLDQIQAAATEIDAQMGQPQGEDNPLMAGPDGSPEAAPNALMGQQGPMALPGQEPQLNQLGGLPLGPGVGPQ